MVDLNKSAGDAESELYYLVSATHLRKAKGIKDIVISVDICTVIGADCPIPETFPTDPTCDP